MENSGSLGFAVYGPYNPLVTAILIKPKYLVVENQVKIDSRHDLSFLDPFAKRHALTSYQEPPARIRLLGSFTVERGDRVLLADDWPLKKAAALLKRLALERRLLKDQAIEFLWPEADLASGANNLYKTLYALRQTLDKALGDGAAEAIFRFEDGVLSLAPPVWVDAQEFERLCITPATAAPEKRAGDLDLALGLYQGDMLPDDRYAEWTLLPRQALYRRQREARLALATHHREAHNYSSAIALLSPLLAHDPADEPVHRELMRLFTLAGQRHEALRQYQACAGALAAELDVPPAPETTALYSQILRGELVPHPDPIQPRWTSLTPVIPEAARGAQPGDVSPPPHADKPRPLFVARERELGSLQSHLEAAMAGEGRIIFISGEAGQGKTSLMAEFAYRAQADHPELVVAAGACQALTGIADPYLPFRDLMAMLSGDWQRPWLGGDISTAHVERLQAIAPHTAQAIADYAPDLVDIIVPATVPSQRRDPDSPGLNQRQIFDQMRQLLRALAHHQPLLLLLDDLQWADSASTNLLFHLGRQLANSFVLIVGAYRPSEVIHTHDSAHPLATVVQELVRYRGDIQMDLDTFVPGEGRNFVDALLDSEPNRLDASFREALFRRTKGHPLFAVELLRALQEQGDLLQDKAGMWAAVADLDWGILPARVEAVIARRIDRLPQELRQLLAVASVEGESFSVEVLAQVQAMAIRPLLQQLSQELDRRYRLVREQAELPLGGQLITRYQFRHNLFQQYLYHQLSAAERRHLHGEIAATLEQIGGDDLDNLAVPLAHHYMAAGDSARAIPHLCRAGDDARRRVALEDAIQFYQSALANWPEDLVLRTSASARAEVLHKLGESLLAVGKSQEAIDRFSEAGRLYAQAGKRTGIGAVQRLTGRSYWEQGERVKALSHYRKALAILEQEPEDAELARAIGAIAQMHTLADEHDEAIAWSERALTLAQRLHTEDVIVHGLATLGMSFVAKGEAERGLAMLAESQERAEELGLPHDACRAYTGLGDSLVLLERYAEARALYERLLAYARKVRAEMFEGVALVQLGYLDWWAGRWKAALGRRQTIGEWMAISAVPSVPKIWASNLLGEMYNDLGNPDHARAVLVEYTAVARSANETQTTVPHLGQLARAAQSEQERAGLVQEMLVLLDATAYARYETLPALRLACTWLAQTSGGDTGALDRLEKAYPQMQDRLSAASLHEVQAIAAGIRGEWGQAVSDFEVAAANWEALQRPYDLLRTLAGLGQALAHTEDSAAIRAVQRQSASLIEQLASELAEPALKQAFLVSPLVMGIRKRQRLQP